MRRALLVILILASFSFPPSTIADTGNIDRGAWEYTHSWGTASGFSREAAAWDDGVGWTMQDANRGGESDTTLDPDTDSVVKGTQSGTLSDALTDNGVYDAVTEANQGIAGTIAFDAAMESERIATTDPWPWTHTPVGAPRSIIMFSSHGVTATSHVVGVKYGTSACTTGGGTGGVSMTKVATAADTATEPGRVDAWFLGTGIPTGAAQVCADLDSATVDDIHFVSMSFTATSDTEVVTSATDAENQANPTATLAFGGRRSVSAMVFYSGGATPPATTACSGSSACTVSHTMDQGAWADSTARQTTAGTTDQVMGWTQAADDVAVAYVAISEIATAMDYEMQYDVAFTGPETCTADTRTLRVSAHMTNAGGENVHLQVDDGSESSYVTKITIAATADPSPTYQEYTPLTEGEWDLGLPNVRFLGGTEAGDATATTINIDDLEILCDAPEPDWEYQGENAWLGLGSVDLGHVAYTLVIRASRSDTEDWYAQVKDQTSNTFATRVTVSSGTETEYTYALLATEISEEGRVDVRWTGATESGDSTQSTLTVDQLLVRITDPTTTWSTTADFDAGTRSNPGDGNYGVETTTDNIGIANGQLELASLKGDSFGLDDADADTWKWNVFAAQNAETSTRNIASGVLNLGIERTAPDWGRLGVVSSSTYSGNVDGRVSVDFVAVAGANSYGRLQFLNENVQFYFDSGTTDGAVYHHNGAGTVFAYTILNGGLTACGVSTVVANDPLWLRITRAGNDWTFYYSTDGAVWTLDDGPCTRAVVGGLYAGVHIADVADDGVQTQIAFDDLHIAAGTVDAGGTRTTGTWTSPAVLTGDEVASTVSLTYTATATAYIDQVDLLAAGVIVETWSGDITSGTAITLTSAARPSGSITVLVTLAGNNAGTPTLEAVSLDTGPPTLEGGHGDLRAVTLKCAVSGNRLRCVATERMNESFIAGRIWEVDGDVVAEGPQVQPVLDWDTGVPGYVPAYKTYRVTYYIVTTAGDRLTARDDAVLDTSWVLAAYGIFGFLIVGAVFARQKLRRQPSEPPPPRKG